jgi:hypothetical protein
VLFEKYEIVRAMFRPDTKGGFDYRPVLSAATTPQMRLAIMAGAIDWVLTLQQADAAKETSEEGKKRPEAAAEAAEAAAAEAAAEAAAAVEAAAAAAVAAAEAAAVAAAEAAAAVCRGEFAASADSRPYKRSVAPRSGP